MRFASIDFCFRSFSLKSTLALVTLGLGGKGSETNGSFLYSISRKVCVCVVGGGEGAPQDRSGPENKVTFSAQQPDCLIILGSRGIYG